MEAENMLIKVNNFDLVGSNLGSTFETVRRTIFFQFVCQQKKSKCANKCFKCYEDIGCILQEKNLNLLQIYIKKDY